MKTRPLALYLLLASLATPAISLAAEAHFTLYQLIPGITAGNEHVLLMAAVAIGLVLMALALRPAFASDEGLIPSEKFGLRNVVELIAEMIMGMMKEIIGHDYKKFVPLIGTLAFFILFSNLMALIPGSTSADANTNITGAMALTVFVAYNIAGARAHGVLGWMAHFMGPLEGKIKYIMAPLMVPIELISHAARPLSLALRLFGNMTGDHLVLGVFMGLASIPLIFPLPFLILGLVVSIVQTLVFCLLSMVYISQAIAHEEH